MASVPGTLAPASVPPCATQLMGLSSADSPEDPGGSWGPPLQPENPPRKEAEGQPCMNRVTRDGHMGSPGWAAQEGRLWYGPLEPGWARPTPMPGWAWSGTLHSLVFNFFLPFFFSFNLKRQGRGQGGGLGREQQQEHLSLSPSLAGWRLIQVGAQGPPSCQAHYSCP